MSCPSTSMINTNSLKSSHKLLSGGRKVILLDKNDKEISEIITPGDTEIQNIKISEESINNNNISYIKLKIRDNINKDEFEKKYYTEANKTEIKTLDEIIKSKYIDRIKLPSKSIGYINDIDKYIKKLGMNSKTKKYFKNITYFRDNMGDGNCFYRIVIFRYLEIIIYNKRDDLFRNLIEEVDECFSSEIIINNEYDKIKEDEKIKIKINKLLLKYLLLLIYHILTKENDIKKSYLYLYICFNTVEKFDKGLILYLRYILYKFISENEDKYYLKEFPIKMGNLLPKSYQTEENFFFNEFYKELLSLFSFAESIIILVIPFIFGINLNILLGDNESINLITYKYSNEEKNKEFSEEIYLIYKSQHYDLGYINEEIEKKKDFFNKYIEKSEPSQLSDENTEKICIICNKNIQVKENNTKICEECILNKINDETMKYIINKKTINYNIISSLENQIFEEKYSLNQLINILKQSSLKEKPGDIVDFIKKVRKQFCVIHFDKINNKNPISIPCGCYFDNINCLEDYLVNSKLDKQFNCNFCGYNFKFEETISIFQILLKVKCCMCGTKIFVSNSIQIKYSYEYEENDNILIHYICFECNPKKNYKQFDCKCCKILHCFYR